MQFELIKKSNKARLGEIELFHGNVKTPAFMPVGTVASVKALYPQTILKTGAEIILGNAYHLYLRIGPELIEKLGGLHEFMNWQKPILTDSGGFQVMSLGNLCVSDDKGVTFKSHIDGSTHRLTPEKSVNIQKFLGSDITMIFDECISYPASHDMAEKAMYKSLNWAEDSKKAFLERSGYGIFGIVQGGVFEDLRKISAKKLIDIGFDGYAVGGLAVGEGQEEMFKVLDFSIDDLPENKPRYLMGVGKPDDIIGAVKRGVDMFDCVMPTRSGRNGQAFTSYGKVNIRNAKYRDDSDPLDLRCSCNACQNYSKSYLHHMVKCNEIIGAMLLTEHNITYYQDLMKNIRLAINNDNLQELEMEIRRVYDKNLC